MSKAKKQKKPQNYELLQKEFEEQKRELLDTTFSLKKMQQRVNFLSAQNYRLERQREDQYLKMSQKIQELSIKNETNEKRLISMRNDLTNVEVENKKLNNSIILQEKNMGDQRAEKNKDFQELKKNYTFELAKYQNMLTDYKLYMNERENRQKEISELMESKEMETANRIREVADKQREKVQATDKIRQQMGNKIRQMRQNLLSLKKEELQTTTRLTMLQNHQLTSQLEYQSKQTQKIVMKNQELEMLVTKLKQELQIHKQVQDELAKRSHFSKGIIKKLHSRVAELEQEMANSKCESKSQSNAQIEKKNVHEEKNMIQTIDRQLQRSQKKYAQLSSRYQSLSREKQQLCLKWQSFQRSKNEIFTILAKGYNQIKGEENEEKAISMQAIKSKPINLWTPEQTKIIIQILLAACQPYLNKNTLSIPSLRKIIVFDSDIKLSSLPKLASDRAKLHQCASEKRLVTEDICQQVRQELSKERFSTNITNKMIIGKVRDWGKPISSKSRVNLQRKYKLSASYRT